MDFSRQEYEARLDKARALMDEAGLDFLFLTQPENLIYLTGYRTILYDSKFRPFLAVLPKQGEPVLILPVLELGVGQKTSFFKDIRAWGGRSGVAGPDPISVAVEFILERKLDKAKAGVESSNGQRLCMTRYQFDELAEKLPGVEFGDSSSVMWALRRVKSEQEVAYVREACRITDKACQAAVEASTEGVSELDVQRILGRTMMDEGADRPDFLVVASGPERYNMMNPYATERRFEKGDMVNLDIGAVYKGYCSDMTRGYFIGRVSDRQRAFYEAAVEIQRAALKAIKPGLPVSAVDRAAEEAIIRLGYKDYMLHRTGHSLGLEGHELPSIAPDDHTTLEPGMVLAVEPGIYDFSIGAFRIEDTVVVTEGGGESLTNYPRELDIR